MTSLVKASRKHGAKSEESRQPQGLSVEEIFGNIFVIDFAGHDTTANTLAFAMFLLATEPIVQEWVAGGGVNQAITAEDDWEYDRLFGKLVRCRAVLVSQ